MSKEIPPLPMHWTRCHVYLEPKRRYCRQKPVPGCNYCGNHQTTVRRIPCPLDPSHTVLSSALTKHLVKCPSVQRQNQQKQQYFYSHNINCGGYGDMVTTTSDDQYITAQKAHQLAKRILVVHQQLFSHSNNNSNPSLEDIHQAVSQQDLSSMDLQPLTQAVLEHHIKSGGPKHLHQQASLMGHLRRIGVISSTATNHHTTTVQRTIVEVGAGRGMTGLMVAGVIGGPCKLLLVERSGTRSKADTVWRKASFLETGDYMSLQSVQLQRIQCDLAHVDLKKVVNNSDRVVVIAKHLCGAGTDLALKAMQHIPNLDACILATCCHGVCNWEDYVGRDYLRSAMEESNTNFGPLEFDVMRRWSSGTVRDVESRKKGSGKAKDNHHGASDCSEVCGRDPFNVARIAEDLALKCGAQGLGRACQRLIDFGRQQFMKHVLFPEARDPELLYYVSEDITPQNAALIATRIP